MRISINQINEISTLTPDPLSLEGEGALLLIFKAKGATVQPAF